MIKMFPEDGAVISSLFERNEGFLLILQVKHENDYKYIAGAMFSRYEKPGNNTMIIDYLAITNESPKVQYSLYDRFLWEGKGIGSLLICLIQAFGYESFNNNDCVLRLKCIDAVRPFYIKIGFEDDSIDYNKISFLKEHQRIARYNRKELTNSLCLPANKQIKLNDESITRPIDIDFKNFPKYKDKSKLEFTKHYRFKIQNYTSSKNDKYTSLVNNLRCDFESLNITNRKDISDNEVLLPIGDIILSMMNESDSNEFYKSNIFQLNRYCLSKILWIITPKKYKSPKDDETNLREVSIRGTEGVACYELNIVCALCKHVIDTINEFDIKFKLRLEIKKDEKLNEKEKKTEMNSLGNETHKKLKELLTESFDKCFCDHFGLEGCPHECEGLTRLNFEDYVDAKDIQKWEMKQPIKVNNKKMKDDSTQHQYLFFNTVFDFFNHFDVVVSTFNWRSFMYNERNDKSKTRRRSSLTYGRIIQDETLNEIAGMNDNKKRKIHETMERQKKKLSKKQKEWQEIVNL